MKASAKGIRRNWIRIPLSAVLVWFASVSIPQGWNTLTTEDDWSDEYLRSTAVVVGGREELISTAIERRQSYYLCHPVVEYRYENDLFLAEPIWLQDERSNDSRGDACADERIGEEINVWIQTSGGEPWILEPGNRNSQPLSGSLNIGFGLLALFGVWRLWFRKQSRRSAD